MQRFLFVFLFLSFGVCGTLGAATFNADSVCDADIGGRGWSNYADVENGTWWTTCDGELVSGVAKCSAQEATYGQVSKKEPFIDTSENRDALNKHCWCKMTSPYAGVYWVYNNTNTFAEKYCNGGAGAIAVEICVRNCLLLWLTGQSIHGANNYYGQGLYGVTAEELAMYKTNLFADSVQELPCEIGISKLVTSRGDSFQLYAEKYTEHALVVQYNDNKCYIKLAPGGGELNLMFDNAVYHVVE